MGALFKLTHYRSLNGVYRAYGQLVSNSNTKQGSEFLVSAGQDYATIAVAVAKGGRQNHIAPNADDRFIVVYQTGAVQQFVFARQYNRYGVALGSPFMVDTFVKADQRFPAIAALKNGGFVVVWMSDHETIGQSNLYGQRFSPLGARLGGEFRLNLQEEINPWIPNVASHPDGGFVTVWTADTERGDLHVSGQRFGADGAKIGSTFKIEAQDFSSRVAPGIVVRDDGSFVVAWSALEFLRNGMTVSEIFAQRFQNDGSKLNKVVRLNQLCCEAKGPVLAKFGKSGFFAVWETSPFPMPVDSDVYGRTFLK